MTQYKEFRPEKLLLPYVQCYFLCESVTPGTTEDVVFASGCLEIMFNIGTDRPQMIENDNVVRQPAVQLWGQTISPFTFMASGSHKMLGVRFFGHTAGYFLDEPVSLFNDQVADLRDIGGAGIRILYERLLNAVNDQDRLKLLDSYFLQRLLMSGNRFARFKLVDHITREVRTEGFFENIHTIANRYGITSRYLQKLFVAQTGLSPKLYAKINRFRKSVAMVSDEHGNLTDIAHQCGYYDQSHFIKDFKYFTGTTPSHFTPQASSDLFVPLNN